MSSFNNLVFKLLMNIFQLLILSIWCFFDIWQNTLWLLLETLIAVFCILISLRRNIARIFILMSHELGPAIGPSKDIQAERERIAADLHDTLGSQLVQALALMEEMQGSSRVKEVLEQSLLDLRLIVDAMDTQEQPLSNRMARLRHRFEPILFRHGVVLHWLICDPELGIGDSSGTKLPAGKVASLILAVTQECISNAIQHAYASELWVSLEPIKKYDLKIPGWDWRLCIEDNGVGINHQIVIAGGDKLGHGIPAMFLRMSQAGGEIDIHPRVGGGTSVSLRWRSLSNFLPRVEAL